MRLKKRKRHSPEFFKTCLKRSKERIELRFLSDRELRDIGLTRVDIVQEVNKPSVTEDFRMSKP